MESKDQICCCRVDLEGHSYRIVGKTDWENSLSLSVEAGIGVVRFANDTSAPGDTL